MDHGKAVNIIGYDSSKGTLASNMRTVSGALAYDNPTSGKTVIIMIHQAIYVPTMECNLICPMQVRMNDVKLDDKPKFLTEDPTDESHAISCEDNTGTLINITLALKGVTSYFPTSKPTKHEFDNCPKIELTYLTPEWDPHSTTFQEWEEALMDNKGRLHEWGSKGRNAARYISIFATMLASTLMECQDDPTHNLSLALNGQYKSQALCQVLDPSYPKIDLRFFHQADWTDFYGDVKLAMPDNAPEPRGKLIILRASVDSDHANDKVRWRSCTGFCFFINMACIIWYTKR